MGCVSSKLVAKDIQQQNPRRGSHVHVVSLTSSTYGVLNLDKEKEEAQPQPEPDVKNIQVMEKPKSVSPARDGPPEIINAWELMEGLEEELNPQSKRSPKSRLFDARSPLKFMNGSPRKVSRTVGGKENKTRGGFTSLDNTPKLVLKESNNFKDSVKKPSPRLWASIKGSPNVKKCSSFRADSGGSRRSLGPLFDPELVASLEKEVPEEAAEIKKIVSVSSTWKAKASRDSDTLLEGYKQRCPPGGENAVVIYTTTLRGIRKTFEDCNIARSVIESQNVRIVERDVSMHSGYKEELRVLMDSKDVRVPLVFVKGRLIGGAEEMLRLDEEGKLGILFDGIPKAGSAACAGCAGFRFVMCSACNGSCKVLGEDGRKSAKCSKCNENGLVQCPFCC